jgi:hypothetical protein
MDLSNVSETVADMVRAAEKFGVEEWQALSEEWLPFMKGVAVRCRTLGYEHRSQAVTNGAWEDIYGPQGLQESGEGSTDVAVALFCLSDRALEILISTFDDEELRANLTPSLYREYLKHAGKLN